MPLELLLQISVAALSAMGTLLMGIGENNVSLPVLGLFVAATSLYFTDHLGWLRLNSTFANLTALVAGYFAVRDMSTFGSDAWLMAIAHLLAYLQFIMLYQEKNSRIYWLLLTLSLLQVAVAAALNLEVWFGIVLLCYLLTGLACLTLFFMYRERVRYDPKSVHEPIDFDLLTLFVTRRRASLAPLQSGVQIDAESTRLGWSFVRRVAVMGFWTTWLTAALFLLFPRTGRNQTNWSSPHGQSRHVTGFSDEVNINDLGELLNNGDPVCKLWLYDHKSGRAHAPIDGLYLRGTMLNRYANGSWSRTAPYVGEPPMLDAPPPSDVEAPLTRQVIEIEPLNTTVLFAIAPWAAVNPRPEVQAEALSMHLTRPPELKGSKFVYELLTWGLLGPVQSSETPNYAFAANRFARSEHLERRSISPGQFRELLQLPIRRDGTESLPLLRAWAETKAPALPKSEASDFD
ncbi:MAG TPA: transglutaminaseTgpA domain-containing protein, partial [Pirellulales bacterium]